MDVGLNYAEVVTLKQFDDKGIAAMIDRLKDLVTQAGNHQNNG